MQRVILDIEWFTMKMTTERSLTATGLPGKDETCKDDPFCIL